LEATGLELDSAVTRSETLLYSEVDGDVTMMSVDTGRYYSLTHVGARIWALIDRPITGRAICDRLVREYRVDRTQCEDEVLRVLRQMADEGVVVPAGDVRT
jgi:hypothetical protein